MEQMTVKEIVEATGGTLLCGDEAVPLVHISIDSQSIKGGELFVPLIGERVNAHRFIGQAFEKGAAAVLTSGHDAMEDEHPWIRVEDTRKALQAIGSYYRNRLTLPLVGITGSVGKTTTREMVAFALSAEKKVYKTPGNKNSQVGVPITLSEITSEDEIGILELGMSMPGELTVIAQIARVDMALITNVGVTHIEQLGSQENICREKLTIQDGLKEGGVLLLNGDDPLLCNTRAKEGCRTVYFGTGDNCDYRAEDIHLTKGCPGFTAVCGKKRVPVQLQVMGRHYIGNAMAALAVADLYGIPMEKAAEKLAEFHGFEGRQQIYERDGVTLIDDSYNASPVSMLAALQVLESMEPAKRRIAVLADMKELGPEAERYHEEIGEWLKEHPVDVLLTLGELSQTMESGKACLHFAAEDLDGLYKSLKELLQPGDCVLLKGSNSMKLGEVARRLRKTESQSAQE
ncbi:MAG: UDP-N-acetylmuramoyl-tripeptide--D-alanyl-D-alanine ligase [Lachnospiraceae bacterium]|jgi:UDP-N-acetylmuramoyl-tripeptide--D-alanyl-D-alanine ligase|nr:UDP-N-acetylmuramoyl-tripeptide--D-alanyl-D-alanine ligase [Lachnospiraceae bacterium]